MINSNSNKFIQYSNNNKFIKLFGYGSVLMIKLFECFIGENSYCNKCDDICNIVSSCKTMYKTCNIFFSRSIILWKAAKDFAENKLNLVKILYYNSDMMIKNELKIFQKINQLIFSNYFNQPLTQNVLPNSLTQLTFGYNFNQPITKDVLTNSLTQLTFGYRFNQPLIKDVLPNNLTQLTFGSYFNQPLTKDVLPNSLTQLTFDKISFFNEPLTKDILPNS